MLDRTYLGAILRTCRVLRGIKQSDLAASISVSAAALSHVESGRNLPSDRVLQAYADTVMNGDSAGEFIDLVMRVNPGEIGAVANLAHPSDPERFMAEFQRSLSKTLEKPQARESAPWKPASPTERQPDVALFQSRGLRSMSNPLRLAAPATPPSYSSTFDSKVISGIKSDEESTLDLLAEFIHQHDGQLLTSKSKSYEFSTGVDISCDFIDIRHRIAFETKRLDRLTTKSIIEFVGKATMFRTEDFRFVVCLVSRPETEQQEKLVRTLRSNSVLVIWPSNLPGIIGYFDGDPVY